MSTITLYRDCLLLVLCILVVAVRGNGSACGDFSTGNKPDNMEVVFRREGDFSVKCHNGYLLESLNSSRVVCNDTSKEWTFPTCLAIPKLGFKDDVTSHDVKSGPLHLTVTMENTVIREFTVNVTLYHHNTEPVERERDKGFEMFKLKTHQLNYAQEDRNKIVTVEINDPEVSGRDQIFTVCVSVINETKEEGGEGEEEGVRAEVMNYGYCTQVTLNNTNKAEVSLIQGSVVFTSEIQLVPLTISYRECDITATICLIEDGLEDRCAEVTIPSVAGTAYSLDLKDSNIFNSLDYVGMYKAELVLPSTDCAAHIKPSNFTIYWTMSPEELNEWSTEVGLEPEYHIHINDGLPNTTTLEFSPSPSIPLLVTLTITGDETKKVTAKEAFRTKFDISKFLSNEGEKLVTQLVKTYDVSVSVVVIPIIAKVTDGRDHAKLYLHFSVDLEFAEDYQTFSDEEEEEDDYPHPHIDIITSPQVANINDYITLTISSSSADQRTLTPPEYILEGMTTGEWRLGILSDSFDYYTVSLSMKNISNSELLNFTGGEAHITYGIQLSIENGEYNVTSDISTLININSSRNSFPCQQLENLVEFEYDNKNDLIKIDFPNGGEWNCQIGVTQIKNVTEIVNLTVTMTSSDDTFVKIVESTICIILVPPPPSPPPIVTPSPSPTEPEEPGEGDDDPESEVEVPSSWSFGGMIAVFIVAVVISVVLYIGYSNKDKILVYVGGGGGGDGEGGRGIISKARKRLRSRGAYKKLPTTVQDAMTGHND